MSPIDQRQSNDIPDPTVARAQAMFHAVIPGWASDALTLRARGLDRPGHRDSMTLGIRPIRPAADNTQCWIAGTIIPAWRSPSKPQPSVLRRAG